MRCCKNAKFSRLSCCWARIRWVSLPQAASKSSTEPERCPISSIEEAAAEACTLASDSCKVRSLSLRFSSVVSFVLLSPESSSAWLWRVISSSWRRLSAPAASLSPIVWRSRASRSSKVAPVWSASRISCSRRSTVSVWCCKLVSSTRISASLRSASSSSFWEARRCSSISTFSCAAPAAASSIFFSISARSASQIW